DPRPRRGGEARRPDPDPLGRSDRRERQPCAARSRGGRLLGGALVARRGELRARGRGCDGLRPGALRAVRRGDLGPRGDAIEPRGELHGARAPPRAGGAGRARARPGGAEHGRSGAMNPRAHASRIGLQRGWTEFKLSLRAPEDMTFYVVWGLGILIYLFVNRVYAVGGTSLSVAVLALPGVVAAMVVFGAVVGPAFTLVLEREDGTLLRAKSAPFGLDAYVAGQVLFQFLGVLPMLILLLVPPAFFLEGLAPQGAVGWVVAVVLVVLGTLAMLPLGFVVGSLARKAVHVSTGAMMPIMGLAAISGIFSPITVLWGWVQVVAQVFPMYWLGHALRWVFLPEEAAALELGGRWNLLGALAVIALWGAVGLALTPRILGRMAQRESGSAVEARKAERLQRLA